MYMYIHVCGVCTRVYKNLLMYTYTHTTHTLIHIQTTRKFCVSVCVVCVLVHNIMCTWTCMCVFVFQVKLQLLRGVCVCVCVCILYRPLAHVPSVTG